MKNYFEIILVLFVSLCVSGCSIIDNDTNKEPEELILGNWYQIGYSIDGEYSDWEDEDIRMFDYQDDGEISVFYYNGGDLTFKSNITYILNDDTIEIFGENDTYLYEIIKLDEGEYIFEREFDVYGEGNLSKVKYHHERRY